MSQFEGALIAGRYEIREHIATGGMASVFKTWDHRVERLVAIKILRSLDKNDLRAVERFRREARAAESGDQRDGHFRRTGRDQGER